MAFGRNTTAAVIKPLQDSITRRVQLGATVAAGEAITLQSDGKWDPTDASTAQLTVRVAVQGGADTEYVDAVCFGPILCIQEATIGGLVYASDTGGEYGQTAGTKSLVIGYAETAAILFVRPQIVDFT
jgi:hypothetical protein